MRPSVAVLTYTPSPYQVELFDAVAALDEIDLSVIYLHHRDHERDWTDRERRHASVPLDGSAPTFEKAKAWVRDAGLFVLNYYQDARAGELLDLRVASRRPWAFWGERPGYRHPLLGRLLRRWRLRSLHGSRAPIWGIGQWAVNAYRNEFGHRREYVDLPYFSNLARFQRSGVSASIRPLTFLYSGALIERKGVDLLAGAFARLVKTHPHVHLQWLGSGPEEARLRDKLALCAGNVTFLGFKDWPSLPAVYHGAHVLCVPSRHDGWALVVPEGLAAGLPVIGTHRTGAALELVRQGENGWMIPAGHESALHDAMREAAELTAGRWQAMSQAASASVSEHDVPWGARRFVEAVRQAMRAPAVGISS